MLTRVWKLTAPYCSDRVQSDKLRRLSPEESSVPGLRCDLRVCARAPASPAKLKTNSLAMRSNSTRNEGSRVNGWLASKHESGRFACVHNEVKASTSATGLSLFGYVPLHELGESGNLENGLFQNEQRQRGRCISLSALQGCEM